MNFDSWIEEYKPIVPIENDIKITLATFPRSGQHFLKKHLIRRVPAHLEFTHGINLNKNKTLTIVRNPVDSISSWASMVQHFSENDKIDEFVFINNIEKAKLKYRKFYKYILKDIDIIIDYNFLNTNIDNIIDYICKRINVVPIDYNVSVEIKDKLKDKHVISSKNLEIYEKVFKIVNKIDMDIEFELYNKTLQKSYPNCISNFA